MTEKNTPEERCACVGWRANACPIHGPAPLADGVTDKNSTLQAVKPLADGGEILTREEYEEALQDYRSGLIQFTPERKAVLLAHDAALRAEVERLREGQKALMAQTVRIRRAICENDAQFHFAEDTETYAKQLKARAEKLAEALRKALAELTHANSNAGTRAEVAVIAARALAEIGEEK